MCNSRLPSSTPLIDWMALTIKFNITCCSCTRSPSTGGRPSASCVRTNTPLFVASVRVSATTSSIASLMQTASFRGGAFFMSARSFMTPASASLASPKSGGSALIQRSLRVCDCRGDRLLHFMRDRGRELTHGGNAVRVRQLHLHVPQRLFCPLALGNVPRDAAVADEAPRLIKHRQARNRYVALAAVGGGSRELKVTERQVGLEGLPVLAPGLRVRLQVRHFPPCLADFRARRRRVCKAFGEFLTDKAMLRIGFPVHVEGELHQCAKALLALAQRLFGPLALGHVDDKDNPLVSFHFEKRAADQNRHAAAVL